MPTVKKTRNGTAKVTFTLPADVTAREISLCGDFNDWSPDALPLHVDKAGQHSVTIDLTTGRDYRYRFLLDGSSWENDWAAQDYQPNPFGSDDSVLHL